MKRLVLIAAVAVVFVLDQGPAVACQCMPTHDPAIEYEQVDAVFMGVVIGISASSSPYFLDIQIALSGYWKGSVEPIMHVYTGEFEGSCGYTFQLYENYLIYAVNSTEECCPGVFTSICNRTCPLANAGTDLEYLGPSLPVPVEQTSWGAVKEIYRE